MGEGLVEVKKNLGALWMIHRAPMDDPQGTHNPGYKLCVWDCK